MVSAVLWTCEYANNAVEQHACGTYYVPGSRKPTVLRWLFSRLCSPNPSKPGLGFCHKLRLAQGLLHGCVRVRAHICVSMLLCARSNTLVRRVTYHSIRVPGCLKSGKIQPESAISNVNLAHQQGKSPHNAFGGNTASLGAS